MSTLKTNRIENLTTTDGGISINNSGNVGIGTTSPHQALDIGGTTTSLIKFTPSNYGTGATDGAQIGVNFGGLDVWQYENNYLRFGTNNTERMRIDTSGRLLSGLTSSSSDARINLVGRPSNAGNGARLHLGRQGASPSSGDNLGVLDFGNESGTSGAYVSGWADANWSSGSSHPSRLTFATTGSSASSPTERVRIDSSGNVVIGATTANSKFHVNVGTNQNIAFNSDGSNSRISAFNDAASASVPLVVNGSELRLTTSGTERMRINSSGRVGIGTSSPLTRGHLEGTSGDDSTFFLTASNLAANAGGIVSFGGNYDGTNRTSWAQVKGLKDNATSGQYGGYLSFSTRPNGGSNTERMRIKSNGETLIGGHTSVATYSRGIGFGDTALSTSFMRIGHNSTGATYSYILFGHGSGDIGSIQQNSGGTAVSFNTTSDYRLKENVVDLDGAIDRVKQLAPKRFNFIADAETTVDGFLAHEAQTVVPEAITGTHNEVDEDNNPVYQGIDQSKLVPLLTAALKEAIAKIETLETEVAALKSN